MRSRGVPRADTPEGQWGARSADEPGDIVHFQSNWDDRRVPAFNADKASSVASMEKVVRIMNEGHAQLRINHDKPPSDALRHEFYE
jgi:N-acyl homoserine lactone hydrolase